MKKSYTYFRRVHATLDTPNIVVRLSKAPFIHFLIYGLSFIQGYGALYLASILFNTTNVIMTIPLGLAAFFNAVYYRNNFVYFLSFIFFIWGVYGFMNPLFIALFPFVFLLLSFLIDSFFFGVLFTNIVFFFIIWTMNLPALYLPFNFILFIACFLAFRKPFFDYIEGNPTSILQLFNQR